MRSECTGSRKAGLAGAKGRSWWCKGRCLRTEEESWFGRPFNGVVGMIHVSLSDCLTFENPEVYDDDGLTVGLAQTARVTGGVGAEFHTHADFLRSLTCKDVRHWRLTNFGETVDNLFSTLVDSPDLMTCARLAWRYDST
jgi:hypothetical protein